MMLDQGDLLAMTVTRLLAAQVPMAPEAVRHESSPADLGLDSLGLVEAIFAIEEAFDIKVPFNANAAGPQDFDVSTVGAMIDAVRRLVAAKLA